jgi:hypothetical protein
VGKVQVALIPGKYFDPTSGNCKSMCDGQTHYFDLKNDPEQKRPLSNIRTTRNGDMFFNGKKCRSKKKTTTRYRRGRAMAALAAAS